MALSTGGGAGGAPITDADGLRATISAALAAHQQGNLREALDLYSRVLPSVAGKGGAELHNNAAACCLSLGEVSRAVELWEASVKLQPDYAQGHLNLAIALSEMPEMAEQAMQSCQAALRLQPDNHKAVHVLANLVQNEGNHAEAARLFLLANRLAAPAAAGASGAPADAAALKPPASQRLLASLPLHTPSPLALPDGSEVTVVVVSRRPLVAHVRGLLTPRECEAVLDAARDTGLSESHVMGGGGAGAREAGWRSSSQAWVRYEASGELRALRGKAAAVVGVDEAEAVQGEDLQVVRYGPGGEFRLHHDSSAFHPRRATLLYYLSDVEGNSGGTWFPFAEVEPSAHAPATVQDAIEEGLRRLGDGAAPAAGYTCRPRQGDALLFFNHLDDGTLDPLAVHAGLPVAAGLKLVANSWF